MGKTPMRKPSNYLSQEERNKRKEKLKEIENEDVRKWRLKAQELKKRKKEYQEIFGNEIAEDDFEYHFNIELKLKICKEKWKRKMKKLVESSRTI